jgi:hypothetical protein
MPLTLLTMVTMPTMYLGCRDHLPGTKDSDDTCELQAEGSFSRLDAVANAPARPHHHTPSPLAGIARAA